MPTIHIPDNRLPPLLTELRGLLDILVDTPPPQLTYLYSALLAECLPDYDDDEEGDHWPSSSTAAESTSPPLPPSSNFPSPVPSPLPSPSLGAHPHSLPSSMPRVNFGPTCDSNISSLGCSRSSSPLKRSCINFMSEETTHESNRTIYNTEGGNKRPRLTAVQGGGDDGGDGGGDPPRVANWGPECNRNGDRPRLIQWDGIARGREGLEEDEGDDDNDSLLAWLNEDYNPQYQPQPEPNYDYDYIYYDDDDDDYNNNDYDYDNDYDNAGDDEDHEGLPNRVNTGGHHRPSTADFSHLHTHASGRNSTQSPTTSGKKGKGKQRKRAPCHDEAAYLPGGGTGRRGKKRPVKEAKQWCADGRPPPVSFVARRHLLKFCTILNTENIKILAELASSLTQDTSAAIIIQAGQSSDTYAPLRALAMRCGQLEQDVLQAEFKFMVALIQLILGIDWIRNTLHSQGQKCPGLATLASNIGVGPSKFRDWVAHGTRLAHLVSAATPSILLVIAALGMRATLTRRQDTTTKDLSDITFALRNPQDDDVGKLLKTILIPFLIRLRRIPLPRVTFTFFSQSSPGNLITHGAGEVEALDSHFAGLPTNYYPLPSRSSAWSLSSDNTEAPPPEPVLPNSSSVTSYFGLPPPQAPLVAGVYKIMTSCPFSSSICPVTKENRDVWTKHQRMKAEGARDIKDLEDLRRTLTHPTYRGHGQYVQINSNILAGKTLEIGDVDGGLVALLITHMESWLPGTNDHLIKKLKVLLADELFHDTSDRPDYKFLALHYSYYNRFAEKGTGAPDGIHPHYVYKDGAKIVNHSQRVPRPSKEIQEDPGEYALLAQFLQEILEFVDANLKHYLPKAYEELIAFVEQLPFNERCPAYPFGGFVINFCVSTRGHRDVGDKILCVVIPFGDYSGGQLCLYEPGLVFNLRPSDILIFPSCHMTHFNLHFEGVRASLVLHSDREGDKWVKNGNGWKIARFYGVI